MAKKNKKKNKNKVSGTAVSNPAVKSAILALKEGDSAEKQNDLTKALLKAKFLVPCNIEPQDENTVAMKLFMMNSDDGKSFFPLFTDQKEADNFVNEETTQYIIRTIKDYESIFNDPNNKAEGLVINPGADSIVVNKEMALMIASGKVPLLRERPKESRGPVQYVEPAVYPTKLANKVYDVASTLPNISRIWLKEKHDGFESCIALFVESDNKDRKVISTLNQELEEVRGELLVETDFITDKILKEVIGDAIPLYDRELEL